jgi:hypothetical protein
MLKIVPDPPHDIHSLEDTLIQATDYALCATTVVHQALLLQPKSPASILMMASMHAGAAGFARIGVDPGADPLFCGQGADG